MTGSTFWFGVVAAIFLLSVLLTGLMYWYALHHGLLDEPNARSSHNETTPRGGGLGFVIVYLGMMLLSMFLPWPELQSVQPLFIALLVGGGMVAAIGFIDDHHNLSARLRFTIHIIAAAFAVWMIGVPPIPLVGWVLPEGGWLEFVAVLAIVWLLNLYNFMDGIDGIASMQAISVLCGACFILYLNQASSMISFTMLSLGVGVTGFLVWNWPPAKIFMGDAASGFLGFSLGVFACFSALYNPISLWSWVILLGLFVVDASWTLLVRMIQGEKWYRPHAKHAYQILARRCQSRYLGQGYRSEQARMLAHRWVVLRGLVINLFWLIPLAWIASLWPDYGVFLVILAFLPLFAVTWRVGAGTDQAN
jgi:Fuc2NAc and GlcNAc transferase